MSPSVHFLRHSACVLHKRLKKQTFKDGSDCISFILQQLLILLASVSHDFFNSGQTFAAKNQIFLSFLVNQMFRPKISLMYLLHEAQCEERISGWWTEITTIISDWRSQVSYQQQLSLLRVLHGEDDHGADHQHQHGEHEGHQLQSVLLQDAAADVVDAEDCRGRQRARCSHTLTRRRS